MSITFLVVGLIWILIMKKAISEDGLILQGFEAELNGAQVDIEKSHDGKLVKFKVYSQDGRLVRTETDNWSKALGGHQIWGSGEVEFDPVKCKYKLTIEIEIEDFYNFNNGQYDIMTGLPDSENGRFEVFGWANSFFSRGKVKRIVTWNRGKINDTTKVDDNGNSIRSTERGRR